MGYIYTAKNGVGTPYPLDSDVEAAKEAMARIDMSTKTQNDIVDLFIRNNLVNASTCSVIN